MKPPFCWLDVVMGLLCMALTYAAIYFLLTGWAR